MFVVGMLLAVMAETAFVARSVSWWTSGEYPQFLFGCSLAVLFPILLAASFMPDRFWYAVELWIDRRFK
jgi:hypothetical protein